MLEAKEHSSLEGVIKIIGIKSAINLGLPSPWLILSQVLNE